MRSRSIIATIALFTGIATAPASRAQSCGDTLLADTVLTGPLTCTGPGLTIGADDIGLDCAGFVITGSGTDDGIRLDGVTGVTVRNCTVSGFSRNFYLSNAPSNYLTRNGALSNTVSGSGGFVLSSSDGNVLESNRASDNAGRGFILTAGSNGNLLVRNTSINNGFRGFDVIDSPANALVLNIADGNTSGGYILQGTSEGNILYRNGASGNVSEGYASFTGANFLSFNSATQNSTFGYTDFTGPTNFYLFDQCDGNGSGGSSPTGLCTPQP